MMMNDEILTSAVLVDDHDHDYNHDHDYDDMADDDHHLLHLCRPLSFLDGSLGFRLRLNKIITTLRSLLMLMLISCR